MPRLLKRYSALVLLSGILLVPGISYAGPLYVTKDRRGVVTITSRQPSPGSSFKIFNASNSPRYSKFHSLRSWRARAFESTAYDHIIRSTAAEHEVDPALVKAVIHAESAFNPKALSPKGAKGLMQLMPGTASRFGVSNAYHPVQNVSGGVKYLKFLLDRYNGNQKLAVAAYNAGEGAVDEINGIPPFAETQTYVRRVMALLPLYRSLELKVKNS